MPEKNLREAELELCLVKIIDEMREQQASLTRKGIIVDRQIELLLDITARLEATVEVFKDVLERMPDAPYLQAKLTRLIEVSLKKDLHDSGQEQGQDIREMFD